VEFGSLSQSHPVIRAQSVVAPGAFSGRIHPQLLRSVVADAVV